MSDQPASFDPLRDSDRSRAAASGEGAAPGPVFVSRGAAQRKRASDAPRGADGVALPSLRDAHVRWLIALVLLLQAYAWWRVSGYQLADSVEFMERARIFVRGEEMIDSGAIRPFGFSFLLVPFFALADWFGMHDQRAVVWCVVVFQMLIGCVLVWRSMRIGAIVAGRTGALAAGLFVGCNPVFLQYSTQPVSDLAAGVCVAFALEGLIDRGSLARSMRSGIWLAVAFVVAYKTLLISLAILAMLVLRDRWKNSQTWRGVTLGIALGLLAQSTMDWVMYDGFGASVSNYLVLNGGSIVTSFFHKMWIRMHWRWSEDIAAWVYTKQSELIGTAGIQDTTDQSVRGLQSPWFYVVALPTMIVWPALAVFAASFVRILRRPSWRMWFLLGVLAACFIVLSNKGSKDFRLWLPLLPVLAPIFGFGWTRIVGALRGSTRPAFATLAVVGILAFALRQLRAINVRHYEGYWTAIDWVDARARDTLAQRRGRARVTGALGEPAPLRVGSAYNWAVFLRNSPLVEVVKLPWQLNMWKQYDKSASHGAQERADDMDAIAELDVLIVHLPILKENPDLMGWVNAHFEVAGAFYDQRTYEEIGPIYVLERRTGAPGARTFFDMLSGFESDSLPLGGTMQRRMDFVGADGERLQLLDVSFETLPPQNLGWVTYRWRAIAPLNHDYWAIDRITSPDETNVWQNNHALAYGCEPSSQWKSGDVLSESFLVVPAADAYLPQGRVRPLGGGYRRGDLIPTRTWMKVQAFDPASLEPKQTPVVVAEMLAARPEEPQPIRDPDAKPVYETPDGIQFSADGFVRVAGFFVPVLPPWRVPDDGRPVPP